MGAAGPSVIDHVVENVRGKAESTSVIDHVGENVRGKAESSGYPQIELEMGREGFAYGNVNACPPTRDGVRT